MRPISHQLLSVSPAILAVLGILLSATPLDVSAISFTPNVACLMTLIAVAHYPSIWPRGFAFCLGLLQDVLFATPLGAQALLMLMLAQFVRAQGMRNPAMPFRLRWLEAAGIIVVWHALLWFVTALVLAHGPSLRHLLQAGLISVVWYPLFYVLGTRLFARLSEV